MAGLQLTKVVKIFLKEIPCRARTPQCPSALWLFIGPSVKDGHSIISYSLYFTIFAVAFSLCKILSNSGVKGNRRTS